MRDYILFTLIGGFAVGTVIELLIEPKMPGVFLFALLSVSLFVFSFLSSKNRTILLIGFVCVGISLGVLRTVVFQSTDTVKLDALVGEIVSVEGVVIDEPDEREVTTRLVIQVASLNGIEAAARILAIVEPYPRHSYGDRLKFQGELTIPESFETDVGRTFDYPNYLRAKGITHEMFLPKVERIAEGEGNIVIRNLYALKNQFLENISEQIAEPASSLLGGLVVGAKQSLGEDLLDQFRRVGIVHIVVLSGYNVSLVSDFLTRAARTTLPPKLALTTGGIGIVLFMLLAGASATAVRASLMALIVVLARATRKTYIAGRALFIVGFLMLVFNPMLLLYDLSFQLSFLATLGLIYVSPIIEPWLEFVPKRFLIREIVVATIATQLVVLPLLLYSSGIFSVVSLPLNLLVLPVVPFIMFVGFFAGLLALISPLLAAPLMWLAALPLDYILWISDVADRLPGSSVSVGLMPLSILLLWYGLYLFGFLWLQKYNGGARLRAVQTQGGDNAGFPTRSIH